MIKKELKSQIMQELCDCAFEQGYGKIRKMRPGVYLPSLSRKIFDRLLEIKEDLLE